MVLSWAIVPFGFRIFITLFVVYLWGVIKIQEGLSNITFSHDARKKKNEKWLWVAFGTLTIGFIIGLVYTVSSLIIPEVFSM